MKILLDNCVPWRFAQCLPDFDVVHAKDKGWEALINGKLLAAAEADGFNALITVDKNFRFQQNPGGRKISLITLNTLFSKLIDIKPLVPQVITALENLEAGTFIILSLAD